MGKIRTLLLFLAVTLATVFFVNTAKAEIGSTPANYDAETINAEVVTANKSKQVVTVEYPILTNNNEIEKWEFKRLDIPFKLFIDAGIAKPEELQKGDHVNFMVDGVGNIIEVDGQVEWSDTYASRSSGFQVGNGGSIWDTKYVYNRLFKTYCRNDQALSCWTGRVFEWSQTAILILATTVMVAAGLIYMTSAGDPKRIAMSKKFIFGALSGVAVMVLGRFFLTRVVGVPWL